MLEPVAPVGPELPLVPEGEEVPEGSVGAGTGMVLGDAEANKLLTRNYRKPFVVPDKV